jgi:uncharacterized membrane protein
MDGIRERSEPQPIAALTYLLGFVTGIIFLYVEPYSNDEFVRFHARQSIGFSIAWFAINIIFSVFISILPFQLGHLLNSILQLVNLGIAVFWVILMYKAYNGERFRIPELSNVIDQIAPPGKPTGTF